MRLLLEGSGVERATKDFFGRIMTTFPIPYPKETPVCLRYCLLAYCRVYEFIHFRLYKKNVVVRCVVGRKINYTTSVCRGGFHARLHEIIHLKLVLRIPPQICKFSCGFPSPVYGSWTSPPRGNWAAMAGISTQRGCFKSF